jgi:hypothetical protein
MSNKVLSLIFIVVFGLSTCTTAEYYSGGTGEPNDPFIIATPEDLNDIGNHNEHLDKNFVLINDVNLAGFTASQFNIIGFFTGVFDGNGKKISNFSYTSAGNYIGLFGYVSAEDAQIKDLGLIDPNIDAGTGRCAGALVGYVDQGTISGCYAEGGRISGKNYVGGLVGINSGTISNCYATGNVDGNNDWIGGLVGSNTGLITKCYSTSNVHGRHGTGGLVGFHAHNGMISWCHATGNSSGNGASGGLVARSDSGAVITNCYSTGDTNGNDFVGGIVGYHEDSTVTNCYSHSRITADSYAGGLVGHTVGSTITNCYSTGKVTANNVFGGLVGNRHNSIIQASFWDKQTSSVPYSPGGVGKTTVKMKTKSTFTDAGWDFIAETENGTEDIWTINEHIDYPRFVWQLVDCAGDFGVDFTDYAALANFWLNQNCTDSNNCAGTDFDFSGSMDFTDLGALAQHWLQSN